MAAGPFVCAIFSAANEASSSKWMAGSIRIVRRRSFDTAFLEENGLTVLRFWNNDVLQNTDGVLQIILDKLEHLPRKFTRPPLPLAGGEELRSSEGVGLTASPDTPTPRPPPASGRGLS